MAQVQSPETFVNGQQVTDARLNNHVNGAQLLPGAITDQSALTANTLASGDQFLINDASASALRKVDASSVLNSGLAITTGSLTGSAGADLVVTPDAAYKLSVAGDAGVTGDLTVTGGATVTGAAIADSTLTVNGKMTLTTTGAMKLPVGTTAQRPGSPVQGDLRYNTTTSNTEVYNGTAWEEVGGGPFDATGGNTIIAPDTTVVSGVSFSSADGYRVTVTHSGHSVTPGQTVEFTTAVAGYSGEFTVYEADATTFKFFMTTVATANSGTGSYRKAGNFKCHIFTSSGTFVAGPKEGYVELLVVGGGGGGGFFADRGTGGGGGVAVINRYFVNANEVVSVTVGAGGAKAPASLTNGTDGGSSIFGTVTAYGGQAGQGSVGGRSGYTSVNPNFIASVGRAGSGWRGSSSVLNTTNWLPGAGTVSSITGVEKGYAWGGYYHNDDIYPPDLKGIQPANTGRGGKNLEDGCSGIVVVRYPYWV